MRVHLPHPVDPRDLVVHVTDPDATVADLASVLHPDRPVGPLLVDGVRLAPATPLDRACIADGAVITRPDDPPPGRPDDPPPGRPDDAGRGATVPGGGPPVVALTVTTGIDAGRAFVLGPGIHRIGRPPQGSGGTGAGPDRPGVAIDDPTVSVDHARVAVTTDGRCRLEDLGSTNGARIGAPPGRLLHGPIDIAVGDVVVFGSTRIEVEPPPSSPRSRPAPPAGSRRVPWHRRRRPATEDPPPPLDPPPPPDPPATVTPVGVLGLVASLAIGAAMVVVLGSFTYALFALLGPAIMVANAADSRRRRRRSRRRGDRRRRRQLAALADELAQRRDDDRRRRLRLLPGPAAAAAVAAGPSPSCWERRPNHHDAFAVGLGRGRAPWTPPVHGDPAGWADDVRALVEQTPPPDDAPLGLVLDPMAPVAVVGPSTVARALVRSLLVQACVAHGPADLEVAVLADGDRAWDWCRWLPHADDRDDGPILAGTAAEADDVAGVLLARDPAPPSPTTGPARPLTVVVVDDHEALRARRSGARRVLRAAGIADSGLVPIVLVATPDDVPAACRIVLEVDGTGALRSSGAVDVGRGVVSGVSRTTAAAVARSLARLDDPEVDETGRSLPDRVALASLLGAERLTVAGVRARWRAAGADPAPRAVIGVTDDGPLVVDLAADGPHVLVGGTTGSGKSELLRTLVTSLAVGSSPDHLTFVLVDFKGGSAFDACARLPHTTGLVTDLDEHLAARALRCLEAEVRHRERRLRAVGADDLTDLRHLDRDGDPLPRLVVVVDEFATLAAELPDFVDALVDVAQRGRSLGIHLVLATQRPSGSVSAAIRANTSLRIALRVQAPADSTDVVDVVGADRLPRRTPGRAMVRLGAGELVTVQTALVTAVSLRPAPGRATAPVQVGPLGIGGSPGAGHGASGPTTDLVTDLAVLAEVTARAWTAAGGARPRRPWPDPLPDDVAWPLEAHVAEEAVDDHLPEVCSDRDPEPGRVSLIIGLADRPDEQRLEAARWRLDDGPLLAVGLPGSGTTTLAASTVLAAAARFSADRCHVHVVDLGAGDLVPMAGLPHVGAVVTADQVERQRRLIDALAAELARRRAGRGWPDGPRRLLVVDGVGAFRARWDQAIGGATWDRLLDVVTRGSEVGIHTMLTADGVGAAPHALVGACRQRLVFRLGDPTDQGFFGVRAMFAGELPPGRAVAAEGSVSIHVARPSAGLSAAVARLAGSHPPARSRGPEAVGVLPDLVTLDALDRHEAGTGAAPDPDRPDDDSLRLPIGLADEGLVPAVLILPPGGHALVAGPPRSGRTTTLATLGRVATDRGLRVVVVSSATDRWPVGAIRHAADDEDLAAALDHPGPVLVLVDDADLTEDSHPVLGAVVRERRPGRHVVAAGRADRLRSGYGHWARELRVDRIGIVLAPDPDVDGDLFGARIPRVAPVAPAAGRGWLAGGEPEGFVQVASSAQR